MTSVFPDHQNPPQRFFNPFTSVFRSPPTLPFLPHSSSFFSPLPSPNASPPLSLPANLLCRIFSSFHLCSSSQTHPSLLFLFFYSIFPFPLSYASSLSPLPRGATMNGLSLAAETIVLYLNECHLAGKGGRRTPTQCIAAGNASAKTAWVICLMIMLRVLPVLADDDEAANRWCVSLFSNSFYALYSLHGSNDA